MADSSRELRSRNALVIGIDYYLDPSLNTLQSGVEDAKAIAAVLQTPCGYGVKLMCTNKPEDCDTEKGNNDCPTETNILRSLEREYRKTKPEDLFLVYFAGHGVTIDENDSCLLACDSQVKDAAKSKLRLSKLCNFLINKDFGSGSIQGASQIVLLLDACHVSSEVGRHIVENRFENTIKIEKGFFQFSASDRDGIARETAQHGIFTEYLIDAFCGQNAEPRANDKNLVTLFSLASYVRDQMEIWCTKNAITYYPPVISGAGTDITLADFTSTAFSSEQKANLKESTELWLSRRDYEIYRLIEIPDDNFTKKLRESLTLLDSALTRYDLARYEKSINENDRQKSLKMARSVFAELKNRFARYENAREAWKKLFTINSEYELSLQQRDSKSHDPTFRKQLTVLKDLLLNAKECAFDLPIDVRSNTLLLQKEMQLASRCAENFRLELQDLIYYFNNLFEVSEWMRLCEECSISVDSFIDEKNLTDQLIQLTIERNFLEQEFNGLRDEYSRILPIKCYNHRIKVLITRASDVARRFKELELMVVSSGSATLVYQWLAQERSRIEHGKFGVDDINNLEI